LANIKSQIKRNRQNEKRRVRNRNYRGAARTAVNLARSAFDTSAANTKEAVMAAISALDKAAEKGVLHPNNAARRKGRLMKRLYALNAPARPAVSEPVNVEAQAAPVEEPKAKKPAAKKAAPAKKAATKPAPKKKTAAKSPAKKKPAKK
jgi:small subunit ribosomal protein S20